MMNFLKKIITKFSHTLFYNKLKALVIKTTNILSLPSSIEEIWFSLKIYLSMGNVRQFSKILYSNTVKREPWQIQSLRITNNSLEMQGWAIAPQGNHRSVNFTINDEDCDQLKYPTIRNDVRDYFWYYPHSENSGFYCKKNFAKNEVINNQPLVFKYINKQTRKPIYDNHNLYYLADDLKLPEPKRRERVDGTQDEVWFRVGGYSAYVKLELMLKKIFNKSFNDFKHILDWGCGCGRVARYFKNLKNISITGVDIDSDNINWCSKNLGFGKFFTIPLHPPTSLKDNFFDLVIGISVFTHLGEKEQYEWLNELRRITSDGAVLLVSIHSDANVAIARLNIPAYNLWKNKGIYMENVVHEINEMIGEHDYYKASFHTHSYIMKNWSKYFEIVDIISGYIGNSQDLVILRKL